MTAAIALDLFDFTAARNRVENVAKARPEHTTGGPDAECRYFEDDGSPSCLVGTAFADELYPRIVLNDFLGNESAITSVVHDGLMSATPKALIFLQSAQEYQDQGQAWIDAYNMALRDAAYYDELGNYIPAEID